LEKFAMIVNIFAVYSGIGREIADFSMLGNKKYDLCICAGFWQPEDMLGHWAVSSRQISTEGRRSGS
jgi:hypothetical protein